MWRGVGPIWTKKKNDDVGACGEKGGGNGFLPWLRFYSGVERLGLRGGYVGIDGRSLNAGAYVGLGFQLFFFGRCFWGGRGEGGVGGV